MDSMPESQSRRAATAELWRLHYPERCGAIGKRSRKLLQRSDKATLAWLRRQKTTIIK
jgi:hypothetical protein